MMLCHPCLGMCTAWTSYYSVSIALPLPQDGGPLRAGTYVHLWVAQSPSRTTDPAGTHMVPIHRQSSAHLKGHSFNPHTSSQAGSYYYVHSIGVETEAQRI